MKRTVCFQIAIVLLILLAASACKPSADSLTDDEIAMKVSEFSFSLNKEFQKAQEAFDLVSPDEDIKAPTCFAEGKDLIIIYEHDVITAATRDDWTELALDDDYIHYPRFEDLVAFVGDDSVRLVIKYIDVNGVTLLTHIIDKEYKPFVADDNAEIDSDEEEAYLNKYCSDNRERLSEEYKGLFDGAEGPDCYVEDLNLVFEYRYTEYITRMQFFGIIEEAALQLQTVADELTAAAGSMDVGLIIRCFDTNGEKLLDYGIGGMNIIAELESD